MTEQIKNQSTNIGTDGVKINSPNSYKVDYVRLYPNKDPGFKNGQRYLEIGESVNEINIKESIFQASTITTLNIRDAANVLESMRIGGNEKLELKLSQEIEGEDKKEFEWTCYISDLINYSKPAVSSQAFQIQAVSEHAYLSQLITLNEPFDNTVEALATNICKSHLGLKGSFGNGGMSIKGIYPNLKPIEALNWLARNTFDNGTPYFFWQTSKTNKRKLTLHFDSYEDLVKQEPIEEYNNIPFYNEKTRDEKTFYKNSLQKIVKISSDLNLSKFNDAANGAYASKMTWIDISKKEYGEEKFEYDAGRATKLNDNAPFHKEIKFGESEIIQKNHDQRKYYINKNSLAYDDKNNYHNHEKDHLQETMSTLANIKYMEHEITVPGNPELFAGAVVDLKLWKSVDVDRLEGSGDELNDHYMGGKYLITTLEHVFDTDGYNCIAIINKDSSKLDLDKEIKV